MFATIYQILLSLLAMLDWRKKASKVISTWKEAHAVLKSTDYIRQPPNSWLIETLSIVNPFTINSPSLRTEFKKEILEVLITVKDPQRYDEMFSVINERISHRLRITQTDDRRIRLSAFVKEVTLDAFLSAILQVNANENLLTNLPDLVIHLWRHPTDEESKAKLKQLLIDHQSQFSQSTTWQNIQAVLFNHRTVIAQTVHNDFDEKISCPMNIIVPGWETMWRVVFYSLLELLRRPELMNKLRHQLSQCSTHPPQCDLLQWILKETLRLYPPTKTIYRVHQHTGEEISISVQQIHHDGSIWGSDALQFRPERFREKLTFEQHRSYLPFSISCPARHGFAYEFAGAILTSILNQCSQMSLVEELPQNQLLDISRGAYHDLFAKN